MVLCHAPLHQALRQGGERGDRAGSSQFGGRWLGGCSPHDGGNCWKPSGASCRSPQHTLKPAGQVSGRCRRSRRTTLAWMIWGTRQPAQACALQYISQQSIPNEKTSVALLSRLPSSSSAGMWLQRHRCEGEGRMQ